jgi:hypothetical protein
LRGGRRGLRGGAQGPARRAGRTAAGGPPSPGRHGSERPRQAPIGGLFCPVRSHEGVAGGAGTRRPREGFRGRCERAERLGAYVFAVVTSRPSPTRHRAAGSQHETVATLVFGVGRGGTATGWRRRQRKAAGKHFRSRCARVRRRCGDRLRTGPNSPPRTRYHPLPARGSAPTASYGGIPSDRGTTVFENSTACAPIQVPVRGGGNRE